MSRAATASEVGHSSSGIGDILVGIGDGTAFQVSRWRGGRYAGGQLGSRKQSRVWVIEKGDLYDPLTKDDAGGDFGILIRPSSAFCFGPPSDERVL